MADAKQNLRDEVEANGRFDWKAFTDTQCRQLGFDSRADMCKAAESEGLEVNKFHGAVRNKPTNRVRNVEVGRVVVCTYGKHYGKQAVITDVVDQARVVVMGVDGALSDLRPQSFPIKRLHLTGARVSGLSTRGMRLKKVRSLVSADMEDIKKQLGMDRVVKQIAKRRSKVASSDFDKFKAWAVAKGL